MENIELIDPPTCSDPTRKCHVESSVDSGISVKGTVSMSLSGCSFGSAVSLPSSAYRFIASAASYMPWYCSTDARVLTLVLRIINLHLQLPQMRLPSMISVVIFHAMRGTVCAYLSTKQQWSNIRIGSRPFTA